MSDEDLFEVRKNKELISREDVISLIHSTLATFIEDGEGEISDRDELVLTINNALCNKIKEL